MSLVSIITPAYQSEAWIARAVRSAQTQTHVDWEMIIVSDDLQDYQAILAEVGIKDPRLRFATTGEIAAGPSRGRNIALGLARGDFITTLDADDEYHPDYLATLLKGAQAYGVAMVLLAVKIKATGERVKLIEEHSLSLEDGPALLTLDDYLKINGCTVTMFSRSLLQHRYLETIRHAEDFFFDLRLFASAAVVPVYNAKLYIYHFNPGSLTNSPRADEDFIEEYKRVIAYLEQDSSLGGAQFRTFLSRVLDRYFRRWAQKYWQAEGGWQGRLASAGAPWQAPPRYEVLERLPLSPVSRPDPEAIAEKHEVPQALQRALAELDDWRRSFWDFLAVGMSLHEIAEELGISYEAAKRERRKLLRWLKVRLHGFQD